MRLPATQVIQRLYKAYDIDATVDDGVRNSHHPPRRGRRGFCSGRHVLQSRHWHLRHAHRSPPRRRRPRHTRDAHPFMHNAVETFYLSGMNPTEMTDMGNIARTIFNVRHTAVNATAGTLTLEAPERGPESLQYHLPRTRRRTPPGPHRRSHSLHRQQPKPKHRRPASPDVHRLQRLLRGAGHPHPECRPGAADHLLRPRRPRRYPHHPRHPPRLRAGLRLHLQQRPHPLRRRPHALRPLAGSHQASI